MEILKKIISSKSILPTLGGLGLIGVLSVSTAQAATVSFMTTVNQFSGNLNFNGSLVGGLSKFDPSLGMLTGVTLSAMGDYDAEFEVLGFVDDESSSHAVAGSISYQGSISINEPGTNVGLLGANDAYGVFFDCMGEADSGFACTDDFFEPISESGIYSGSTAGDATPLLQRLELNDLVDLFVGTDNIDSAVLEVGLFAFIDGIQIFEQDNFTIEDLGGSYVLGPTIVSIAYEYTPVVVPVPASAWLFGTALSGLVVLRRKHS